MEILLGLRIVDGGWFHPMSSKNSIAWMEYITAEVRALCDRRGLDRQVRRHAAIRATPVAASTVSDYEWKLIPRRGREDTRTSEDNDEGTYYVLAFDEAELTFVLQHDTNHGGLWGPHFEVSTFSRICWMPSPLEAMHGQTVAMGLPPTGWLGEHLDRLLDRFAPNFFSST